MSVKIEVGCRDDTVPKTVETREHATIFRNPLLFGFWGLRNIVACSQSSLQCLLVSTVFGTVSSLHPTSFLMIFTLLSTQYTFLPKYEFNCEDISLGKFRGKFNIQFNIWKILLYILTSVPKLSAVNGPTHPANFPSITCMGELHNRPPAHIGDRTSCSATGIYVYIHELQHPENLSAINSRVYGTPCKTGWGPA